MARITSLISSALPLVFSVIAIAFAIRATTSKDWASQKHFDPDVYSTVQSNWSSSHPSFILYRSPFITCNKTNCFRYRAYGFNNTSCELYNATQNSEVGTLGDERLCQQIHMAGNLAIASTTFIGIGFLITIFMTAASILATLTPSTSSADEDTFSTESKSEALPSTSELHSHHHRHHARHPNSNSNPTSNNPVIRLISPIAPYLNLSLITFLSLGAAMYFLAQFYGVIGLVQSSPDNGQYSSNGYVGGGSSDNGQPIFATDHMPWIQGKAITVYGSLAWLSSVCAATAAGMAWRLPRVKKTL